MKGEYVLDMESKRTLLYAINQSLKQQNREIVKQCQITNFKQPKKHKTISKSNALLIASAISIGIITAYGLNPYYTHYTSSEFRTQYLIENLRGDTVETWKHWNVLDTDSIVVNIVNADSISDEKIDAIRNAILSEKTVQIEDYLQHKGPKGSSSTYYEGWTGAVRAANGPTAFYIPQSFTIIESSKGEGQITIRLATETNADGYTGYTKSTVENDQILKSAITIYDANELSVEQIEIILRHEFGHALGLAHSTASEDLMAPIITTPYPYISECDIDAITALYNGKTASETVCEK